MTMRLYLVAADTVAPLQLTLAKGTRSADAAIHVLDMEDAHVTPFDGWGMILADLERIAGQARPEPEPEYQAPPAAAPPLPLQGGTSVPAALRDEDPDDWRRSIDHEIGDVAY